jgi:2,3-bisphosphoglycerate-dependent phosphoglycerate mutase
MSGMERICVLVRHGQSAWNLQNLFTGWQDPPLTELGQSEAREAGRQLNERSLVFDKAYTSCLVRAQDTLALILEEIGQPGLETVCDSALNERDYGELTGLNKDDAAARWGKKQVQAWRRSYDVPPPGGESLKDTLARTVPYYLRHILPDILDGKRIIVVAHGNSLRAMIMGMEGLSPAEILSRELATGVPILYRLKANSRIEARAVMDR